ncbi:interactor of constitutive active rops 2 chloroplastic [Phtheirospermum japonicum]|uniref:Interactor of constitutive active rops 2 chloroplastic n=1 Tax=Phtheirospermum japonicum TaxID=374723 RepID=A0A830BZ79_9LAMI|nr:interactor of constitutive active rops 2 chloroplastic [Phtheirospermum japonicum]
MQTPISTRPSSLELPQKSSRVVRKLKTPGSDSDSPNPIIRTPKDKSPKVVDRRSPRNMATEVYELKKAKDQLGTNESSKRRAELDAEEAKKHLAATSAKLEQTQRQLDELSESDDARVQELRKISQDRDRAWQSELEALQKQQSFESAALASALNEAQKLKSQLERVSQSARTEIQSLRDELAETLKLVEKLREEVNESRENEARAREEVTRAEMELEPVSGKRRIGVEKRSGRLRAELEAAEKSYRDEYIQSTLEIRNAYELVDEGKIGIFQERS